MAESVALIDYGAGNLHSVENALRRVGADVALVYFAGHGFEVAGDNRLLAIDGDSSS